MSQPEADDTRPALVFVFPVRCLSVQVLGKVSHPGPLFWRQVGPSMELEQEWAWGRPDPDSSRVPDGAALGRFPCVGPVAFPDGARLACFWASGCAPLLGGTRPTRPFQTRPPAGWLSPVRLRRSGVRPRARGRHFGSPKLAHSVCSHRPPLGITFFRRKGKVHPT